MAPTRIVLRRALHRRRDRGPYLLAPTTPSYRPTRKQARHRRRRVPGRGAYRAVDLVAVYVASQRRRRAYAISVHARASGALAVGLGCFGLTVRETPHDPWQWRLVEDAYGRTLAYLYLDADADGRYERLFNEDLMELGLARTTTFTHTYRREFERAREQAEQRGAGLWSACPDVAVP
jgi:hypothetical protein